MNKSELQKRVMELCGVPRKDAVKAVEGVLVAISEGLEKEGSVRLAGFGNFVVRERAPRKVRNPRTGEMMEVPAKRVIVFKPSSVLQERIA